MARPQRNNVDYFPFLCKEGKAMYYIEQKYGNDGYATWIKLLRQLAVNNYHYINLNDKIEVMFLASKCRISEETLYLIIKDLCDLGEFNEQLWNENKILWSDKFIEHIKDAYLKRNNKCITFDGLLTLLTNLGIRKQDKLPNNYTVNTQSKVKKIKEEESKVYELESTHTRTKDFKNITDYKNCQLYEYHELNDEFKKLYTESEWNAWKRFNKHLDDNCEYIRKIENQIKLKDYILIKKDFIDTKKITVNGFLDLLDTFNNYKPATDKYNSVYPALRGWLKNEIK